MKLLIVKISSLGDVIHAFAFVNRLKAEKPDTVIDWVVGDIYAELVGTVEGVRKVIPFRKREWGRNWWRLRTFKEIGSFIKTIRSEKYDICLDLQGLFRSGLITYLSGASLTAGFADGREGSRFFYEKKIAPKGPPTGGHAVDKLLGALDTVGVPPGTGAPDLGFTIPNGSEKSAGAILLESGIDGEYIVFHTGARWKTKLWPDRHWRSLAEAVYSKYPLPILFTGTSDESERAGEIAAGLPFAKNFCGKGNLLELASILRRAKLVVTVDSGPMHMAAALGVPVAAIFGPTSPGKTGPVSAGKIKIFSESIECVPCLKRVCGRDHECMTGIEPKSVAAGIAELIGTV